MPKLIWDISPEGDLDGLESTSYSPAVWRLKTQLGSFATNTDERSPIVNTREDHMRPIRPSPFMLCLIGLVPLILLAVLAVWWIIKKAGAPRTLQEQNLQNNLGQQLADTPGNHGLAISSIILSILGFVLPGLSIYLIYFPLYDYIKNKIGTDALDYLLLFIPMILWIAGPLSITAGILYLKKDRNNDVLRSWRTIAKIGIGLGTLTIPVVLCPLLLLFGVFYECTIHHGC